MNNTEVVVYDTEYYEIENQDFPDDGHLLVCRDRKRLFSGDWIVARAGRSDGIRRDGVLGCFSEKSNAEIFANALASIQVEINTSRRSCGVDGHTATEKRLA